MSDQNVVKEGWVQKRGELGLLCLSGVISGVMYEIEGYSSCPHPFNVGMETRQSGMHVGPLTLFSNLLLKSQLCRLKVIELIFYQVVLVIATST